MSAALFALAGFHRRCGPAAANGTAPGRSDGYAHRGRVQPAAAGAFATEPRDSNTLGQVQQAFDG